MTGKLWWLLLLATMALIASYQDIKQRKIPNGVVLMITLVGVFFVVESGQTERLAQSLLVLCVGMGLFYTNIMAAGDSKLLAAFSLMISPSLFLLTINFILFAGGTLALVQWFMSRVTGNAGWVSKGVPYGMPICLGSILGIAASL